MERLYAAALEGDIPSLLNLLIEDPLILDRSSIIDKPGRFFQSPLHIAVKFGQVPFAKELIQRKPNMCLARDQDGCNPVHTAAMEGQISVLCELLNVKPQAAREQTHNGETALHLCVKYNQYDALIQFVEILDDVELLNFKDNEGNTILHLAVTTKQLQMVKFLLENKSFEKDAINTNGLTAMDICLKIQSVNKDDIINEAIWVSLKEGKAPDAETVLRPANKLRTWLDTQSNALMVVASLIATMAFQVGISPPGGFWPDDNDGHTPGFSIFATKHPKAYNRLLNSSTVALVTSLSVILLLVSGLPVVQPLVAVLMITMWAAISATCYSFLLSVNFVSGKSDHAGGAISKAVLTSLSLWGLLLLGLMFWHGYRLFKQAKRRSIELQVFHDKKFSTSSVTHGSDLQAS